MGSHLKSQEWRDEREQDTGGSQAQLYPASDYLKEVLAKETADSDQKRAEKLANTIFDKMGLSAFVVWPGKDSAKATEAVRKFLQDDFTDTTDSESTQSPSSALGKPLKVVGCNPHKKPNMKRSRSRSPQLVEHVTK